MSIIIYQINVAFIVMGKTGSVEQIFPLEGLKILPDGHRCGLLGEIR